MKITGTAEVQLDAVDMEQALINAGASQHKHGRIFLILAAAHAKPEIIKLKSYCEGMHHRIIFRASEENEKASTIKVIFDIAMMTQNQIIAIQAGL